MALVVTLAQQDGDQSCKHLYVQDTTGIGATGYAAPNYEAGDVEELVVDLVIPNTSEYTDPYIIIPGDAAPIMAGTTNLDINSTVIDQSLTTLSALEDGAYYLRYTPYWAAVTTISVTNNSTAVTGTLFTTAPYAGVNRAKIDGEYYGFTVTSATTATLDTPYIGTTSGAQAWFPGFSSRLVLKQTCNADRCISAKIAKLYNENCQCKELEKKEVFQKKEDLYGANILFDNEDFVQFQLLMNQITNYCNDQNSGCNCH